MAPIGQAEKGQIVVRKLESLGRPVGRAGLVSGGQALRQALKDLAGQGGRPGHDAGQEVLVLLGEVRGAEKAQQHPGHAARRAPVGILVIDVQVHPVFIMTDENIVRPQTAGAGLHHGRATHIFHQDVATVVVAESDGIPQQILQADFHVVAAMLVA